MPDDRASLPSVLRALADAFDIPGGWDRIAVWRREAVQARAQLLAFAAELERPRALVEWSAPTGDTVEAHLRGVGMIWRGSVTSAPAHAERWRAAGLDVTEVPRG